MDSPEILEALGHHMMALDSLAHLISRGQTSELEGREASEICSVTLCKAIGTWKAMPPEELRESVEKVLSRVAITLAVAEGWPSTSAPNHEEPTDGL